jgi:hypothetical protein
MSYSKNFGTYAFPFPPNITQFSLICKLQWYTQKFSNKGYSLTTMMAGDIGNLYNNNLGVFLGIKKTGIK